MKPLTVFRQLASGKVRANPTKKDVAMAETFLLVDVREAKDRDLIAMLLAGAVRGDLLTKADGLLNRFQGNVRRVLEAEAFLDDEDLGPVATARVKAAAELARRARVHTSAAGVGDKALTTPEAALQLLHSLADHETEQLIVLFLNNRSQLRAFRRISSGSSRYTLVDPQDILREALQVKARAMILCHNHPSGDVTPSREDEEVTKTLVRAGRLMGIPLLDHIIVGAEGQYYSFQAHGMMVY